MAPKDAQQAGNVLVPWEICGRSSDREDRRAQRFIDARAWALTSWQLSCHSCQTVWVLRINLNRYASRVVGLHKTPLQPFPTPHSSSLNGWEPAVELQKACYTKSSSWSPGIWSCTSMHRASATIPIARCTASAGEHMWDIPSSLHSTSNGADSLPQYKQHETCHFPGELTCALPCFNKVVCSNGAAQRLPYHAPVLPGD